MERQLSGEDWVAIQPDPFATTETRTSHLRFKVAWNEQLHKIAIVCHEEKYRAIPRTLSSMGPTRLVDSKQKPKPKDKEVPVKPAAENGTRNGWTTMVSIHELQYAHEQMCLVRPELAAHPPALPFDPRGIWSWVYAVEIPDDFADELVRYLSAASVICGKKLLTDTLFSAEVGIESYVENYGRLRQSAHEEDVATWKEELRASHQRHSAVKKMVSMMDLYDGEDAIMGGLAAAQAELFNLYLQPYLDLRELAFNHLLNLQDRLEEEEGVSEQGRERCTMEYSEWQEQYIDSIEAINKLRIKYFEQCLETTKAVVTQMEADSKKFGKASWEMGGEERLANLQQTLSQDSVQILQAKRDKYKHGLGKIKQELACLDEGPKFQQDVERLQAKAFDLQLKLFDTQLGILQDQESQCSRQLKQLQAEIQEAEDNFMFYDAVENMEDLDPDMEAEEEGPVREEQSRTLEEKHARSKVLRSRVARINKRKAQLRNNKQLCLSQNQEKFTRKRREEEDFQTHHKIQMKRTQQAAEDKSKKDFFNAERQKTIERLKNYNMKYPSAKTIKPHQIKKQGGDARSRPTSKNKSPANSKSRTSNLRTATSRPPRPVSGTKKKSPSKEAKSDPSSSRTPPPPPPYPPPAGPSPPPPPYPPPAGPSPPPPPPPPPPAPPTAPPPPPPASGGRLLGEKKGEKSRKKEEGAGTGASPSPGLDLGSILKARGNLQKRKSGDGDGAQKSSRDPMMDTLSLIRQGVKLRQVQGQGQGQGGQGQARKATPWENSELFNVISKLRSQVETTEADGDDDSDDEFT